MDKPLLDSSDKKRSPLYHHYTQGVHGNPNQQDIILQEQLFTPIMQVACWAHSYDKIAQFLQPLQRHYIAIDPLKWWVIGDAVHNIPAIDSADGVMCDLSHARTHITLQGDKAVTLLQHFITLDLRPHIFTHAMSASTAMHHVGVTLWRQDDIYHLFIPRNFALSIWELLCESAAQYGYKII